MKISTPYEGYPEIKFRARVMICTIILALGMLFSAPHPGAVLWIPLYPLGFSKAIGLYTKPWSGQLSYAVFGLLIVATLGADRARLFSIFAIFLCIVCAFTTKGCHEIIQGLSGIH